MNSFLNILEVKGNDFRVPTTTHNNQNDAIQEEVKSHIRPDFLKSSLTYSLDKLLEKYGFVQDAPNKGSYVNKAFDIRINFSLNDNTK